MTHIHYTLRPGHAQHQLLEIEARFPTEGKDSLRLQLPAWRPGRYELGNFAANILHFELLEPREAVWKKTARNEWHIACDAAEEITIRYRYYAAELNAGSTWLDDSQMYVNPVNCFFFLPDRQDAEFHINLEVPEDYDLVCGLPQVGKQQLLAKGVQQLMDSPFIAAENIWKRKYEVEGIPFHIAVCGRHGLDEAKLLKEFEAFTRAQLKSFGDFPVSDYHFLFQFPDHETRHGVEHENSTVITLGPPEKLLSSEGYLELLGISCHELYHTWNIKCIRPAEMMPYDFTKENYSRLGYVAEGVTTYYGDLYLCRSQVISETVYLGLLAENIQRHLQNPGRFNLSVADSSFDTWVDGYVPGTPNRKVSIYNEGALTAFLCDVAILKASGGTKSLDDGMRIMYERFGKLGIGYTESDYRKVLEECAGTSLTELFDKVIYGTDDYLPYLQAAMGYLGVSMKLSESHPFHSRYGAYLVAESHAQRIAIIEPGSPADLGGLAVGDRILTVNGLRADEYLSRSLEMDQGASLELTFLRKRSLRTTKIERGSGYFPKVELSAPLRSHENYSRWLWKSFPS